MYVNEVSVRNLVARMVQRITSHLALRDDLMQEALIHLWLTESRRPGQTLSWYLQGCRYHLLHYLSLGRSLDSAKRRFNQWPDAGEEDSDQEPFEGESSGDTVLTVVIARDIIALLVPHLTLVQRTVLYCFADGLGPRDIGRRLGISHTMVIKHRSKIASILERLESSLPVESVASSAALSPKNRDFAKESVRSLLSGGRFRHRVQPEEFTGRLRAGAGANRQALRNLDHPARLAQSA